MSALNVIQFPGQIHMFGDTASYNSSAEFVRFQRKIYSVPTARAIVGIAGKVAIAEAIYDRISGARSIPEILQNAESCVEWMLKNAGLGEFNQTILVAGFAFGGEQQLWKMNFRSNEVDAPKFIRMKETRWEFLPAVHLRSPDGSAVTAAQIQPRVPAFCETVLQSQRAHKVSIPGWNGDRPACIVGGDGVLVTITPDQITERVVCSWPDTVGSTASIESWKEGVGIDAGSSTNYTVDTSAGLLKSTTDAPTMISAATGTAIGNMTGSAGLSVIFDGVTNAGLTAGAGTAATSSGYAGKNYTASPKRIDHVVVFGSNDNGFRNSAGTIQLDLYGKNGSAPASATDGTLLGTLSFSETQNESGGRTVTSTDAATFYDYVWVRGSSAGASLIGFTELQFYEVGTINDMVAVTVPHDVDASVDTATALFIYDPVDLPALDTDLTAELSCDGGANWTAAPLSVILTDGPQGHVVVETDAVACTAGTEIAARIKTFNGKNIPIYGLSIRAE